MQTPNNRRLKELVANQPPIEDYKYLFIALMFFSLKSRALHGARSTRVIGRCTIYIDAPPADARYPCFIHPVLAICCAFLPCRIPLDRVRDQLPEFSRPLNNMHKLSRVVNRQRPGLEIPGKFSLIVKLPRSSRLSQEGCRRGDKKNGPVFTLLLCDPVGENNIHTAKLWTIPQRMGLTHTRENTPETSRCSVDYSSKS